MAISLGTGLKNKAVKLRKSGYSLSEIATKLNISKSSASLWIGHIKLNFKAQSRIEENRMLARKKAANTNRDKAKQRYLQIRDRVHHEILKIDFNDPLERKILCSLLYWGEGGKTDNYVSFINSDPIMISTFIKLLRSAFSISESKFRALVHMHEYHNEAEIKDYWSKTTNIPISQFTKSYLKPHTSKNTHPGFMGTIKIKYFDSKIVQELKAIYNALSEAI